VDTVGELAALYASADVAFVGGSLVPIGLATIAGAGGARLPVLTGPITPNSKDIARLLLTKALPCRWRMRESWAALRLLFADPKERRRIGTIGGTSSSRIAAVRLD